MATKRFEVTWEGVLPASPQDVWDGLTKHAGGWVWPIEYEPRVGGAERGLTPTGGTVTVWDPPHRFGTRTRPEHEPDGYNELDYRFEPHPGGTYLRYVHRSAVPEDDYHAILEGCRCHTSLYNHSLGAYAGFFAGREPTYVVAHGPDPSSRNGLAKARAALGLADPVVVGQRVSLRPEGLDPIDGVVDYVAPGFLGIRADDALYRLYDRGAWGGPLSAHHHLFAPGADGPAQAQAWSGWLERLFS